MMLIGNLHKNREKPWFFGGLIANAEEEIRLREKGEGGFSGGPDVYKRRIAYLRDRITAWEAELASR